MGLRMLLLQARLPDDPARAHEHGCFVASTGLRPEDVVPHDLTGGPPSLTRLRTFDMLSVGGSGDFYVSRGDLPEFEAYLDFLREVVALGHPTFASCFGYQSLARALGAEVVHDPANAEVGTFELNLTEAGRSDALFQTLPERFWAHLGHKDRACSAPTGTLNLAGSARSPFQALRIPGKPVWACQFHPEMDRDASLERLRCYMADYGPPDPKDAEAAFARFLETPDTSKLLVQFLSLVFG